MNQIILVGRVIAKPSIRETSSGNKVGHLLLEVTRPYKNAEGDYENEVFDVTLWKSLAEEAEKRIEENMSVGIKGRLAANNYLKENEVYYRSDVVAEKITFYNS